MTFLHQQIAWGVNLGSLIQEREYDKDKGMSSNVVESAEQSREELVNKKQEEEDRLSGKSQFDANLQNIRQQGQENLITDEYEGRARGIGGPGGNVKIEYSLSGY
ncbi:MAG: hypothetical protein NTV07_04110, partial [Candidatus Omnitrophica bacterium]|nr:hypothetical protein [Candidatus Omnitrophota bacterium]